MDCQKLVAAELVAKGFTEDTEPPADTELAAPPQPLQLLRRQSHYHHANTSHRRVTPFTAQLRLLELVLRRAGRPASNSPAMNRLQFVLKRRDTARYSQNQDPRYNRREPSCSSSSLEVYFAKRATHPGGVPHDRIVWVQTLPPLPSCSGRRSTHHR